VTGGGSESSAAVAAEPKRPDLAGLAFWTTLAQVALPLTSLISGPILARTLGPDGRGVYAAVLSPLLVLSFVANVGLPDATTYAVARLRIPKPHVVAVLGKVTLAYSIVAAGLLIGFAPLLLHRTPQGVTLLQVTALTLPAQMFLTILRQTTSGSADFKWRNVERALSALLRLVGLVLFAIVGWLTVASSVWVTVITSLVGVPILLVALFGPRVWPELKSDPQVRHERPHLTRELMRYGFRGWGGTFAYLVNWRLDQAVMVVLVDAKQLGYYAVAVSLAELPQTAFIQLRNILFAESARRDDMLLVARGCRVLIAFTVVMAVAGAAISPVLVPLMFGHAFEPAVLMSQILLVGTIPFLVGQVLNGGLMSLGQPFRASAGQLIGAVFTLTGLFTLCPHIGAVGAAWTSLAAYTVNAVVVATIFCRETGIRPRQLLLITRGDLHWLAVRVEKLGRRGPGARGRHRRPSPIISERLFPETAIEVADFNPVFMDTPVEAYVAYEDVRHRPPEPPTVEIPAIRAASVHAAPAEPATVPHTVVPRPAPDDSNLALVFQGDETGYCPVCGRRTIRHVYAAGRHRWIFFGPPSGRGAHTRSVCLSCGDVRTRR
jgi:O-antigen/teichoic acid export membrane protein